jgi:hypothetical protein
MKLSFRLTSVATTVALAGACQGLMPYNTDTSSSETGIETDTDTDTDTEPPRPIDIDQISPDYGTTTGGLEVEILGGPFDNSAEVFFGTEPGVVQTVSADRLTVATPANTEGVVDVEVVTDTRNGGAAGAFTYWLDGTDQIGAVGEVSWYHYLGNYWADPPPTDYGHSFMFFVVPTPAPGWQIWYTNTFDSCESEHAYAGPDVFTVELGAATLDLTVPTSGATMTLERNSEYPYYYAYPDSNGNSYADDMAAVEFQTNGAYGLQPIASTSFPPIQASSIAATPGSNLDVTLPNLDAAEVPRVSQNFTLQWNGTPGDYILAYFLRYESGAVVETVSCALEDDGNFSMPSSVWSDWHADEQVTFVIGRARVGTSVLSHNHATTGVTGVYWVVGAAFAN